MDNNFCRQLIISIIKSLIPWGFFKPLKIIIRFRGWSSDYTNWFRKKKSHLCTKTTLTFAYNVMVVTFRYLYCFQVLTVTLWPQVEKARLPTDIPLRGKLKAGPWRKDVLEGHASFCFNFFSAKDICTINFTFFYLIICIWNRVRSVSFSDSRSRDRDISSIVIIHSAA